MRSIIRRDHQYSIVHIKHSKIIIIEEEFERDTKLSDFILEYETSAFYKSFLK